MKILTERPKIADKLEKTFDVEYDKGNIIITYEGNIYNAKGRISSDLLVHEMVHIEQQKNDPDWWSKYFEDPLFRLSQELEAYRAQYKFIKSKIKDRNNLYLQLINLAGFLAGPMYGSIVSMEEAMKMIKQ